MSTREKRRNKIKGLNRQGWVLNVLTWLYFEVKAIQSMPRSKIRSITYPVYVRIIMVWSTTYSVYVRSAMIWSTTHSVYVRIIMISSTTYSVYVCVDFDLKHSLFLLSRDKYNLKHWAFSLCEATYDLNLQTPWEDNYHSRRGTFEVGIDVLMAWAILSICLQGQSFDPLPDKSVILGWIRK